MFCIPPYARPDSARHSLVYNGLGRLFNHLLGPLAALGAYIRRLAVHSQVLNINVPPFLESSMAWQGIRGLRVESALWLLVAYAPVDFLLRNVSALSFLAGGWDELLIIFIIAAWPLQGALGGGFSFRKTSLDIPVLIYAGIVLFIYFMRSRDASLAMEGARVYLEYLLWFFIAANLVTGRKHLKSLSTGLIMVATALSLVGVAQFALGVEMPPEWVDQAEEGIRTRVFSIVTSPNVLGSFLVLFIPVTLGTLLGCRQNKYRLALTACLAIMLACLVFTYSRGAWLALAGALLMFSFLYRPGFIIPLVLGGLAAVKLVPGIGARLSYMFSPAYFASSQRGGRVARWSMGLERLKNDPWLGEGFGRFGGAVASRRIPGSFYVDNFYLKTAVESGLVGLLAFIWLLFCAFRAGVDSYRRTNEAGLKLLAAGILARLAVSKLLNGEKTLVVQGATVINSQSEDAKANTGEETKPGEGGIVPVQEGGKTTTPGDTLNNQKGTTPKQGAQVPNSTGSGSTGSNQGKTPKSTGTGGKTTTGSTVEVKITPVPAGGSTPPPGGIVPGTVVPPQ